MIIKTTHGNKISFVATDHKSLIDSNGAYWRRDPPFDTVGYAAYTKTEGDTETVLLGVSDLVRVCSGNDAMCNPINLDEMRDYILRIKSLPGFTELSIDDWDDRRLQNILDVASDTQQGVEGLLLKHIKNELRKKKEVEMPTSVVPLVSVASKIPPTSSSIPKKKTKRECYFVQTEHMSVQLTAKQLEFMERLSENPDWDEFEIDGEYLVSQYAEELSDTMNSMTVGAVITTLREKKLLVTDKKRVGAIKCSYFKLTEFGKEVYERLANRGN